MGKGFFDIETKEPAAANAGNALANVNRDIAEAKRAFAAAEKEKAIILQELDAGKAPELILYKALGIIGMLTNDPDFTEAAAGKLDKVYSDLAQLSLIDDNAAIARERLEEKKVDFNDKLRRSIKRQLSSYKHVEDALYKVLDAIDDTELDKNILK